MRSPCPTPSAVFDNWSSGIDRWRSLPRFDQGDRAPARYRGAGRV